MQHILYRQKEQFSDGVGYGWIDGLKAHAEKHVKHDRNLLFSNPIFFSWFQLSCKTSHIFNYWLIKFSYR